MTGMIAQGYTARDVMQKIKEYEADGVPVAAEVARFVERMVEIEESGKLCNRCLRLLQYGSYPSTPEKSR